MKRFFAYCIILMMFIPLSGTYAKDNTAIETFINSVRRTNTFVPVTNIWQADNNFDKKALLENVAAVQPLTIDYNNVAALMEQKKMAISLVIPGVNGGSYTIDLARYEFLTNDFQVHTLGENNVDEPFHYTPGLYYRGVVNGIPGSVAAFSFFRNEVYGIFSIPGEGNYTLVPNTMVGEYYDYNTHYVLYNDNDLKITQYAPKCDADQLPDMTELMEMGAKTTTTLNNKVYNNCTEVRVFEVGDYALYLTRGSSVTNVTNFLTALFNNQSTVYRNEGVPIVLKYVQVNSAKDNYQNITVSSSKRHLDTFGKVTKNVLHGCDFALLMSTHLNGGYGALGGIAWLKSMCRSYNSSNFFGPYAFCNLSNSGVTNFPTYSWNVSMTCHEMGHILGSPHTHRCCWNPPGTGTTAIDGCTTLEGSCPDPGDPTPAVGGTLMSYCHLTSTGVNLSNGFGPQPGDTIRRFISNSVSSSCQAKYTPTASITKSNKALAANRECTDLTGGVSTTYYWYDNNTADHADDTLVLMMRKNGNNIGNLNTPGFAVTTGTLPGYGSGRADTVTFPAGTLGVAATNMTMQRYWRLTTTVNPTSAVEVMFPFRAQDTTDVNGSVPVEAVLADYRMYTAKNPVDPSPASSFPGATSSSFKVYTYGAAPSTTNWSLTTIGTTHLASMMMTDVSAGGTGFYPASGILPGVGIMDNNLQSGDVLVYPNPTNNVINIVATEAAITGVQIIDLQGRVMKAVSDGGKAITIPVGDMANGMYFMRIQMEGGKIETKKITVMK